MTTLNLKPGQLTLADLRAAYQAPVHLTLDASAHQAIDASVACVNQIIAEGRTAYGINTGFGLLPRPASPTTTWKSCSVRWCCPTPPASVSRWMTPWCG